MDVVLLYLRSVVSDYNKLRRGLRPKGFAQNRRFISPKINYDMIKIKEISFVGQPILEQILKLLEAVRIQSLINKHQSDRYY